MLKRIFRQLGRKKPNELTAALLALPQSDVAQGVVSLFVSGELRFFPRKRARRVSIYRRFYDYHKENPRVADWFLQAARELKNEKHRERYGAHALMQQIRWNVRMGVVKTETFRISNDLNACYSRLVLMRDPSLCGLFALKRNTAEELVIDGHKWADFARDHEAELWPESVKPPGVATTTRRVMAMRKGVQSVRRPVRGRTRRGVRK